jgi:hypothetical protein
MQEETALQDIAARATTMHQKAKQMKADKLVDYLSAGRQTTLVADLMAQNQRLRAAAIAQGARSPFIHAPAPSACQRSRRAASFVRWLRRWWEARQRARPAMCGLGPRVRCGTNRAARVSAGRLRLGVWAAD